jgi:hypothetical protein
MNGETCAPFSKKAHVSPGRERNTPLGRKWTSSQQRPRANACPSLQKATSELSTSERQSRGDFDESPPGVLASEFFGFPLDGPVFDGEGVGDGPGPSDEDDPHPPSAVIPNTVTRRDTEGMGK